MLIGAAIFIGASALSLGSFAVAYYSPNGGYYIVVYGFVLYGAGDFSYGLAGLLGLLR